MTTNFLTLDNINTLKEVRFITFTSRCFWVSILSL